MIRNALFYFSSVLYYPSLLIVILGTYFSFFLPLLLAPFFDVILVLGAVVLGLVSAVILIFVMRSDFRVRLLPIGVFAILLALNFFGLSKDVSRPLYFQYSKGSLEEIVSLLERYPQLQSMSDLKRYYKNINDKQYADHEPITTRDAIAGKFGDYLHQENIPLEAVMKIRELMDHTGIIWVRNYEQYTVFTIDCMLDNEYGMLKLKSGELKLGQSLQPWGFTLNYLEALGDGWYFWTTT